MAVRESVASQGERRSRLLRMRFAEQLVAARTTKGLSRRELARQIGVSTQTWARGERGAPGTLTVDLAARMAPAVGMVLAMSLHPDGDPVRDRAHLALINRLRERLGPDRRLRIEVPMPIAGDRRSGDALLEIDGGSVLIEAETHLGDIQEVERRAAAKQRDLGATRLVLLVADTAHNRRVIREHAELRERFPASQRACIAAVRDRRDPGGDALLIL